MDFYEIQIYLIDQLSVSNDSSQLVRNFLSKIKTKENSAIVDRLEKLDFEKDANSIEKSITNILSSEPPKIKVKGFWFGIFDTHDNGKSSSQAYLCGSNKGPGTGETAEWAVNPKYFPESRYFGSKVLNELPEVINEAGDNLEIRYFSLWYLAVVVANYCKSNYSLLLNADKCIVSIGFDSGDFVNIGQLSSKGFELIKFKIQKPKALKRTRTNCKYYGIDHSMTNAWYLTIENDSDLPAGFATSGKPIDSTRTYHASALTGLNRYQTDYNQAAFANPIVSQKMLDLLIQHCDKDDFEYVPIEINNAPGLKYYLLNVLKTNRCLNEKETTWMTEHYAAQLAFDENKIKSKAIFRLKSKDIHNYIYINSEIKEALEANEITGLKLVPVRTV
jgi:hypothetical protein